MKFYTSYFAQIRYFKPYQLAFSTAMWNPAFFRTEHIDSEGRLIGLRANPFIPGPLCRNDCHGPERCLLRPEDCLFLKHYMMQLKRLKIQEIILSENFSHLEGAIARCSRKIAQTISSEMQLEENQNSHNGEAISTEDGANR